MKWCSCSFFFFNDTATTEIYTLSLHDALPILGRDLQLVEHVPPREWGRLCGDRDHGRIRGLGNAPIPPSEPAGSVSLRGVEHVLRGLPADDALPGRGLLVVRGAEDAHPGPLRDRESAHLAPAPAHLVD